MDASCLTDFYRPALTVEHEAVMTEVDDFMADRHSPPPVLRQLAERATCHASD